MAKKTTRKLTSKTTKKKPTKKTKAKTGKQSMKKTVAKKTPKKVASKKTANKRVAVKKAVSKTLTAKKTEKPVRKAVRAVSSKKPKISKTPEVKFEDLVESRNKAMQKIKGYSKKDLEHFKQIILEKRDEIIEQLQNLREQMLDPTTGEYINENSPYSLHMAEQGTDAQEREKLYLWAQRENKFLGYLEEALQRIENGTYGICIECLDEPKNLCPTCPLVPKERLMAVPHTQMCVQVKMNQKK